MRKTILAAALAAAAALPGLASAQGSSPHSVSGNMGVFSDYRFRGVSQTFGQPAIQGGIDYAHASGFYLGNWNSNVSAISYTDGSIEMDFYGGYKFAAGPVGLDVGLLQYYYPGADSAGVKYDTLEAYVGASWKWFSVKYSVTLDDWFGVANSDGSGYLDIGFSYEIAPKLTLSAHYGDQTVKNSSASDYSDTKIGITYDLNGWALGLAYVDTDIAASTTTTANGNSEDINKGTVVFSVSKSF
ncbi:MAG TPA: TorF family putative porin [Burkholderiales bacterium]|nr:TorF family putative porin [Burkholderiales bacterium]